MTLPFTRRPRPAYVVESLTTTWKVRYREDGSRVLYRLCGVRYPDGRREVLAVREDLLEVAA